VDQALIIFEITKPVSAMGDWQILSNFITMRKIIGLSIIVISFLGFLFFQHYRGDLIVHPFLWFLVFFLMGYIGLMVARYGIDRGKKVAERSAKTELEKFKAGAQKFDLDLDGCEFKDGSYCREVQDPNIASIGLIPLPVANYANSVISENVTCSHIIYCRTANGKPEKYISQSFPFDAKTLEYHVINKDITLYIDNNAPGRFLFDLKKLAGN
jgi:hypothetical protein